MGSVVEIDKLGIVYITLRIVLPCTYHLMGHVC